MRFEAIAHSWVARHPDPIGVVQFLGGALYGSFPTISYSYFLSNLHAAGYTVIVVPFPFGFNHAAIAKSLLVTRDQVRTALGYPKEIPHIWVGHSLGCKYIALLEAYGKIMDEPSVLIAPDIADTQDALPVSALADLLDRFHLGVQPTKQETQKLICESNLFNLTAIISFDQDTVAGTQNESVNRSDVAWLIQTLTNRVQHQPPLEAEIPGEHREPVAIQFGDVVLRPSLRHGLLEPLLTRKLEPLAINFLLKVRSSVEHAV
jgi:hypothetical protein